MPFTPEQLSQGGRLAMAFFGDDQVTYNQRDYARERAQIQLAAEPRASAKCPCCGSRQFVTHHSRRICSYCRSEQDGQVEAQAVNADRYVNYYSRLSRLSRPEALCRLVME